MVQQVKSKNINSEMTTDAELAAGLATKYDASNPSGFETPAQLNIRDTNNRSRGNHTGTQLASTISDFAASVRGTVLSGLDTATNAVITASDNVLGGLGKLQKQITDNLATLTAHIGSSGSAHANATQSVDGFMSAADKLKLDKEVTLIQTTTVNNTSNSTYVNLTNLSIPVENGKAYKFHAMINFTSAATSTGITLGMFNTTASGTLVAEVKVPISNTAGTSNKFSGPLTNLTSVVTSSAVGATGTVYCAEIMGTFVCTTTGTIYPRFRSEINNSQISVQQWSTLTYQEL